MRKNDVEMPLLEDYLRGVCVIANVERQCKNARTERNRWLCRRAREHEEREEFLTPSELHSKRVSDCAA